MDKDNNHFHLEKETYYLTDTKQMKKEIFGSCILKELSYFDVGRSFMADTLHNAYIGAFVRRLF